MEKTSEDHWRELSEKILTDLKEWRSNHPKATFREIEEEVHSRMSRLEAQMIQDTAQQSQSQAKNLFPANGSHARKILQNPSRLYS